MFSKNFPRICLLTLVVTCLLIIEPQASLINQQSVFAFVQQPSSYSQTIYLMGLRSDDDWKASIRLSNYGEGDIILQITAYSGEGQFLGTVPSLTSMKSQGTVILERENLPSKTEYLKIESNYGLKVEVLLKSLDGRRTNRIPPVKEVSNQLDFLTLEDRDISHKSLILLNPNADAAKLDLVSLDSDGQKRNEINLTPLSPMECRTIKLVDILQDDSGGIARIRIQSDQVIAGLQILDADDRERVIGQAFISDQDAIVSAAPIQGLNLIWPAAVDDRSLLGNDYAQYGRVVENQYHTGLDIGVTKGTTVRTAASGRIIKIQENDTSCGHAPGAGCEDHGYGNTVIIEHNIGGNLVYTQYSHLDSIEPSLLSSCPIISGKRKRRACSIPINAGATIGKSGGSGYGLPSYWTNHLHFEIKTFSTLGTTGDDSGLFGYTPNHPDSYGYRDPILNLHSVSAFGSPIRVTVTGTVSLRVGPGGSGNTAYRVIRSLNAGEQYDAIASASPTTTPSCPSGWYQIIRTDGARFPDSSGGQIPDGWVCSDFVSSSGAQYEGFHDGIDCDKIFGWAWNKVRPGDTVNVDIYDGSTLLASNVPANQFRSDLPGGGFHAFNYPTPASLKNGQAHTIYVRFSATGQNLASTPKSFNSICGGGTPVISVTPSSLNFNSVPVGSSANLDFTVRNIGSGTLSGSASVAAPFSIFSGGSYNLTAGQSQFVTVRFSPTAAQSFTQNVNFTGGGGTFAQVTGTGTGGASSQPAQITSPTPGSTLSGSNVTFAWSAGTGVSQYWLYMGSSLGGLDIYNANQGTNRSVTVGNIPIDGRLIYVRLWSFIGAGWQWNDYTYTAASAGTPIISVTPSSLNFNSVPVGSSANLNFTVQNVGSGTLSGSASVAAPFSIISGGSYNLTAGQSQSVTVRFSPAAAQFYSQNVTFTGGGGATRQVTGTGTSAGAAPTVATGSATSVTSSSVTLNGTVNPNGLATTIFFQWGTTTSYGNQTGSQSVGSGTSLLGVSANLSGLSTGTTYHYRIVGSNSNGTNVGSDVSFTTSSGGGGTGPAQITIPTPGSTFSGASVTFAWTSSSAASGYWLFIGSSLGGADIYNQDQGLNLSKTVNGIPTDGRIIYVRLWTFIGGWLFNDYTYRAASSGGGGATNRLLNSSFESGPVNWVQFSSAGFANITSSSGTAALTGSWLAWLGGADNLTEYIYQDVTIPANATQANVQFYYKIVTNEGITTTCFDRLTVEVRRSSDNAILGTLTTRCNNNQTNLWTSSGPLNVFSFRGQTIRLRFIVTTDSSLTTSFFLDDVTLVADGN